MKKLIFFAVLTVIFVLSLSELSSTRAQEKNSLKIGFVNIKDIFQGYKKNKDFEKEIKSYFQQKRNELNGLKEKMKKLMDIIKMMDPDNPLRIKNEKELVLLKWEYKRKKERLNLLSISKLYLQTTKIYKEIRDTIDKFAKENGYFMILKVDDEKIKGRPYNEVDIRINHRVVLYYNKKLDITQKILDILNEKYKSKNE